MEIQTKRTWKGWVWLGTKVLYHVVLILFVLSLGEWNVRLEDQQLTMYQDIMMLNHNQAVLQDELDILDNALGEITKEQVEKPKSTTL